MTQSYLDPYRQSHARHGTDFLVTLWASPKSQELRFRILAEMCFLPGKTLLDVGCGRGDLAAYLLKHQVPYARYIGIDALPELIQFAISRSLQQTEFVAGDVLQQPELLTRGKPQIILISGTLNTMDDTQVHRFLTAAWEAASEALLFNFLSARCEAQAPPQEPPIRRIDPLAMLDWALRQTSNVALRQNYFPLGHDATICMRKS